MRYIERTLIDYGFETRILDCEVLISMPKRARLAVDGIGDLDCITHSMSPSVPSLTGEVVYCGVGNPSDYQRVDARGRIALTEGIAMPGKVRAGEQAGAIGQIHISGDQLHEMCISTIWGSPTIETAALLPTTPSVSVRSVHGDALRALLRDRAVTAHLTTEVDTRYTTIPNLIADLPGGVERDHFVLFSGHVDSWHLGAMDNGTANAAQLEVARALSAFGPNRRSLRLAFWSGHSQGRYAGSTWYADHHWEELNDACVAHVNVDSLGGAGATVLTTSYAVQELRPLARAAIAHVAGQTFEGRRVGRAGDHSFMGIGVPALFMDLSQQPVPEVETPTSRAFGQLAGGARSGGLGWWWHTTSDTVDKIDPALLERDARVYLAVLDRLLNDPIVPLDFRPTAEELERHLSEYQDVARGRFDLSPAVRRAQELRAAVDAIDPLLLSGVETGACRAINDGLMRVSRILTPLNYTEAGRFDHDPAFNTVPIPLLRDVLRLEEVARGSWEEQLLCTSLQRRQNAVCFALREATAMIRSLTERV